MSWSVLDGVSSLETLVGPAQARGSAWTLGMRSTRSDESIPRAGAIGGGDSRAPKPHVAADWSLVQFVAGTAARDPHDACGSSSAENRAASATTAWRIQEDGRDGPAISRLGLVCHAKRWDSRGWSSSGRQALTASGMTLSRGTARDVHDGITAW